MFENKMFFVLTGVKQFILNYDVFCRVARNLIFIGEESYFIIIVGLVMIVSVVYLSSILPLDEQQQQQQSNPTIIIKYVKMRGTIWEAFINFLTKNKRFTFSYAWETLTREGKIASPNTLKMYISMARQMGLITTYLHKKRDGRHVTIYESLIYRHAEG